MRPDLPTGTVTFLFTDVEGSTRLLHELGAEGYAEALAEHRRLIREACAAEGGVEVDTQGDAFFFAFPTAPGALSAASVFTDALAGGAVQVRVGLHTGTPLVTDEGYVGDDVHFAARVAASSHGGQVVLSQATCELAGGLVLTDLGEHRLKDIAEAVAIFQLGGGSFPPLKTISNTNLPRPASSFLGRDAELAEVLARIDRGARMVTLTGPGGTGKTRLAIEAAASLVPEYRAGVFWIGLAALRDPALVTETIAQTLGAKDGLAEHVGERELLLLLDNLEQVIDAAPELASLLESCPNLTLLVTSRELLRVRGEVEYPVPPLAEPEAVSLFCERAQLERSEEIAALCARLDSLPLAVELAVARTKALTPAQILERLSQRLDLLKGGRDADPRQQTLRATIEWSYDLLSPAEQQLFARLSVFAGGCMLEAAEDVCDADLDTLQSLVEKSLVRFTGGRYWMLETIREYALERLEASNCADVRRRHAGYYSALAARVGGQSLWQRADAQSLEQLDAESANVREALIELSAEGDSSRMLETAVALGSYWFMRGQLRDGQTQTEAALAMPEQEDSVPRARALSYAAKFAIAVGELDRARAHATGSLEVAERLEDPRLIGQALHDLAELATEEGSLEEAKLLYERAIARADEVDHPGTVSVSNLALIALMERDYPRAHELSLRVDTIFRQSGNKLGHAEALSNLAISALYLGQVDESRSFVRESLDICVELSFTILAAYCLEACAAILVRTGRPREAARLLGASQKVFEEVSATTDPAAQQVRDETLAVIHLELADDQAAAAIESGGGLTLDEAVEYALSYLD